MHIFIYKTQKIFAWRGPQGHWSIIHYAAEPLRPAALTALSMRMSMSMSHRGRALTCVTLTHGIRL